MGSDRAVVGAVIERHYTTLELAEALAVHPETVRRAAARGGPSEYVRVRGREIATWQRTSSSDTASRVRGARRP